MRERKVLLALILILTVFCVNIMPFVQDWWKEDASVTAKAGVYEEMKDNLYVSVPGYSIYKDRTQELGSDANPFIVLEIVPYEGFGEFGYLIDGCEPLDFEKLRYRYVNTNNNRSNPYGWSVEPMNDTNANNVLSLVNSILYGTNGSGDTFSWTKVSRFADDYDASHERVSEQIEWNCRLVKDWEGKGEFNVSGNVYGDDFTVTYVGEGGEYKIESYSGMSGLFPATRPATLRYTRNGAAKQETIGLSTLSDAWNIYVRIKSPYEYEFHNKGYFLSTCLRVPQEEVEDFRIRVVTVTPETLNANLALIDAADYVSFNDTDHVGGAVLENFVKYYRESSFSESVVNQAKYNFDAYLNENTRPNFAKNDLSWAATVKLLCKVSYNSDDFPGAPITFPVTIMDKNFGDPYTKSVSINRGFANCYCTSNITQGLGKITNVVKLYYMLIAPEEEEKYGTFYDRYIMTGLVREGTYNLNGTTVTTGYFPMLIDRYGNTDAAFYWNPSTFVMVENFEHNCLRGWYSELPNDIFAASHIFDASYGDRNFSVRNNILTFNGDCSTTQQIMSNTFERKNDKYHSDPFTIDEFADRSSLSTAELMYYLLHHRFKARPEEDPKPGDDPTPTPGPGDVPFELKMKINDSSKLRNYVNVDYDAQNVRSMLDAERFVSSDGTLYSKVKIQVDADAGRVIPDAELTLQLFNGEDGELEGTFRSLTAFEKYQIPAREASDITKQTDSICFKKAWNYHTNQWETIQLGKEYYIWLPLRVLHEQEAAEIGISEGEQTNSKEKWEFSCTVSYSVYENKEFTRKEISMKEHKSLTFIRRAMFRID